MRRHTVASLLAAALAISAVPSSLACGPQLHEGRLTLPERPALVRPASTMRVFAAKRRPTDALPRDSRGRRVVARLYAKAKAEAALRQLTIDPPFGRILSGRSRLLVNAHGVKLYAAPTVVGGVCWEIADLFAACDLRGMSFAAVKGTSAEDLDPTAAPPMRCYPLAVVGIVPDQVRSVKVLVAGLGHPATMGRNAFLYMGSGDADDVDGVVVYYRNGAIRVTRFSR